jgi:hypothetical protein
MQGEDYLVDAIGYFEQYQVVVSSLMSFLNPRANITSSNQSMRSKNYCIYYKGKEDIVKLITRRYSDDLERFKFQYDC